ncbi:MAG: indolepyruvate oxidoreductase subunit beta [Firmicutes bacterium]|nr:indolepyruvate oxidoreductase subunit beta [Bacillota bacterium]
MSKNIILCGVGGQGTVLASRLISAAAMAKGLPVMSAETIGMAQRGGSVFSHLRIGDVHEDGSKDIFSPMIALGEADLILAFEPAEAVRMLLYLKDSGRIVVSNRPIQPVTATLSGSSYDPQIMLDYLKAHVPYLTIVDIESATREVGSSKVVNLILLGAALAEGALGFTRDEMRQAIIDKIPAKFHELNFKALDYYQNIGG